MTLDWRAFLRDVVERLGRFAADRRALITILQKAGINDWEAQLLELRKTPEYQAIALRYQVLLKQVEVDADFEALAQIMQELGGDKPPN